MDSFDVVLVGWTVADLDPTVAADAVGVENGQCTHRSARPFGAEVA